MPTEGNTNFGTLKKSYSKGVELEGKTLGIIGLGRIGQEAAKIGLGFGMQVVGVDPFIDGNVTIKCKLGSSSVDVDIESISMDEMLAKSDFITMHIPYTGAAVLGAGLDVFINEPSPRQDILSHPRISLTPHIGAATLEAQEKIGTELASKIIEVLKG